MVSTQIYGLDNMLVIPQQDPLKYGFSGIEIEVVQHLESLNVQKPMEPHHHWY